MEIIWHGYACFELVSGGYTVVLDPYRSGTLAGFPPLDVCADEVLCSHGHDGHGAADAVKLRRSGAPSPFEAETVATDHDVLHGRLRGENLVHILRAEGLKVGLFRPITLWPFPEEALRKLSKADHVKAFVDVEMSSTGQMIDDVKLAINCDRPVHLINRMGGNIPGVDEIVARTLKLTGMEVK